MRESFRAAGVEHLLGEIRSGASRLGLGERPWLKALMFTPGTPGTGARMVFTVKAHKERPGVVFFYGGFAEAIHEFWPRIPRARIAQLLPSIKGYRYLSEAEVREFMAGLTELLAARRRPAELADRGTTGNLS